MMRRNFPETEESPYPMSDKVPPSRSVDSSFVRRVAVALLMVGLAMLLVSLANVLLLLFGATLIAVILRAIADPLSRWMPARAAVLVALLALAILFGIAAWLFGRQVAVQVTELREQLPQAWSHLQDKLGDSMLGQRILASIKSSAPDGGDVWSRFGNFALTLGNALGNAVVALFAGVYLALQPTTYREGAAKLFPKERGDQVRAAFDNSGRALKLWLFGQLVSMSLVGVLTGVGLWLVGVPSALALGLIAGLAEFIPMAGPILSAVPGLLLALPAGTSTFLWALGVYVAVQQVESNLVTPLVEKRAVSIPPALTLFGILASGVLFGPLGVLLGAPIVVVAYVLVKQLWVRDALGHQTKLPGGDH